MKRLLITAIFLAGCAANPAENWQQHVTPRPGNTNSAIAYGDSEQDAQRTALLIARAACDSESKKMAVTDEKHDYNGPSGTEKTAQALTQIGLALYNHNTGNRYGYRDSEQHYKTTLTFTCE